jgi:hypothetical protein
MSCAGICTFRCDYVDVKEEKKERKEEKRGKEGKEVKVKEEKKNELPPMDGMLFVSRESSSDFVLVARTGVGFALGLY